MKKSKKNRSQIFASKLPAPVIYEEKYLTPEEKESTEVSIEKTTDKDIKEENRGEEDGLKPVHKVRILLLSLY